MAWQSGGDVSWLIVIGVLASGVVVLQFPLELGVGQKRAVFVLDGAVMVIALVLLPPEWAILTLSPPPVVIELATARRTIERMLMFAAGVPVSHVVAVAFFLLATQSPQPRIVVLVVAAVATYVSLGTYHLSLLGLLRLQGQPPIGDKGLFGMLLPAPTMTAASAVAGAFVVLGGQGGPLHFVTAVVAAGAVHLLYWQYRRMDVARTSMRLLFDFTADVHRLEDPGAVEVRATEVATVLLSARSVEVVDHPPASARHAAAMQVDGRTRWLAATLVPSNIRDRVHRPGRLQVDQRPVGTPLRRRGAPGRRHPAA